VSGDRLIRASTAAVVTAVAAFAAVVWYSHIYDLGRAHGQSGTAARLLPLSVDGLILAASLVMLHEARNRRQAPGAGPVHARARSAGDRARQHRLRKRVRVLGAVICAWPAVAFIGAVEMVMGMVRRARSAPIPAIPVPAPGLNGHGSEAERVFAADLAAGRVPGIRRIRSPSARTRRSRYRRT
jgi:hypothetical protein